VSIQLMMPFYGDVGLFREAVASVIKQEDPDWRLVVVDNRYPATEHVEFLEELGDERIHYVLNDRNLGIAGNFQRCADLASGSHAAIIGADDVLLPNYVGRVRELAARHPDATLIQPGVEVIDGDGVPSTQLVDRVKSWYRPRGRTVELRGEDLAVSLLRGDWTYFPSLLWSVEFLHAHPFRTGLHVVMDTLAKLEVAYSGGSLVVDDVVAFRYRRHRASISSVRAVDGSRFAEERALFAEAAERAEALGWRRARRVALRHSSSRLNALTRLPAAIAARDGRGLGLLMRHAFGSTRSTESAA
jgi:Predicted glycosyltransferases